MLLIHGISLCSTCWVVNQPDESLAFILADKGKGTDCDPCVLLAESYTDQRCLLMF